MMRRLVLVGTTLTALTLSAAAFARDDYVYGPVPDWERYKAVAEPVIRAKLPAAKLVDPGNWSIHWPNGYAKLGWRHKGRYQGYSTCGYVQQIVSNDGRYRHVNFVIVIDRDQVQTVDISSHESNSLVNVMCDDLVSRGVLPPASLMSTPIDPANAVDQVQTPGTIASLGLTIRAMPEGAYLVAASPGSSAERAGLKPGMVLARVNGIPLAGLGDAMTAVLGADTPLLSLETVTGQRINVRKVL